MSSTKQTVLVAEDDVLLMGAITKKLQLCGFTVVSCGTGKEALKYLEQTSELPDVVWLDFYLGDMDGLEIMGHLKIDPRLMHIPVIVVSNSTSVDKAHNVMVLGAEKFLVKAKYRLDEIVEIVRQTIAGHPGGV
jgi:CheY-like chemotaxis protein